MTVLGHLRELKTLKGKFCTKWGNGNMERDTNRRRLSTDSGAPSSNLDGENQRHETELKQPINRHLNKPQFRNFTRHGGKSGNMSDASSVTSYNPQTSDTETSMNLMREVEKVIGKRPSKKGKESPYNVHIGKIVIHNNPKQENPYYYDHPPPPPCANYTYIKDQETRSVYNNMEREPIEQGSTPRNNSMEIREEEELHAMINPYRETEDFVIGQRTTTNRIPGAELAGSIHVKNDKDYGYIVKNPELNIDDANGELEITLRMGGSKQMVYSGKLIPNLKQVPPSENTIPQDTTPYTQHEPDGPRVTEEPQAQQVNAPTDIFAMQDNRVLAATSQATPTNGLAHGNVTSTRAVSAPDLAQQSSSDIRNLQIQTGLPQNQNNFNLSSSVPGISTISPDNQVYGRGNDLMLPQLQKSRPKSEKSLFNFSKSKVKQRHACNIDAIIYSGDEREINRIREDLLEYGKEGMWQLVGTKNQPTHPFSLLVYISGRVLTYPISEDKKGKFSIDNKHKKTFPCLCSLVNYYKSNTMPMVASNLGPLYIHSPPSPVQYISPTYSDTSEFTNTRL